MVLINIKMLLIALISTVGELIFISFIETAMYVGDFI